MTGIAFKLLEGATVTGTVLGDGVPLGGALVKAYQGKCDQDDLGAASSDSKGKYAITNLPAGAVYVRSSTSNQPQLSLVDEYYDGGQGTIDCKQAAAVTVSSGQTTAGIDLFLEQ